MASGKTSSDAYRPLNIWQRWKLHHAVKALRSPFHSVRVAAHREIAKILRRGSKGTKRMGQRMGRHITAARQAPRDLLGKAARALWGHKHGWDHTVTGRGKGAPLPIRKAVADAGRTPSRTGPVLTNRRLKERARSGRAARNGAGGRGAEGLDLSRNPQAMAARASAMNAAATERAAQAQEQANRQQRSGPARMTHFYDGRDGVVPSSRPLTPAEREKLGVSPDAKPRTAEQEHERRDRKLTGEPFVLTPDGMVRENGDRPQRDQSRGKHAKPGDGDRAVNVGVVNTGPETVRVRGQATGQRSADLGDAARGLAAAASDTARSASRDSGARNIGVISTGSGHVNARNFAVGDGATATHIGHTTSRASAGREGFKQADAPVRSASNPGHEHGPAAPAGTPHGRDKAPPLPSETVREAPDRGSRGRSR